MSFSDRQTLSSLRLKLGASTTMLDVHLGLLQYGIADVIDEDGTIVAQRVQVALVVPPRLRKWVYTVSRYLQARHLYSY
ncbi:hypothetical protein PF005_g18509 [Phytophthora fragariae]|uniref:Uncharacterized protein n=2 Tax=Phytophthora TaxID=4783 RepID=A0A6A4CP44_9STRA|nr:hypothetical protein PF009_g18973 [Phytophthora fragariae]KAE8993477.1 hypothetical protein PF011_g17126 [Phytophthora fragariae]KAE9074030.1 hypothetical protein PF010_g24843 [Phytophthora fragariae]KAE9091565.1 hypothetical protein PF007_g18835 [Phytophthora fragariae]KAE9122441.1 hypothetical protein PF006_g17654 [Phytophthora fragariae]